MKNASILLLLILAAAYCPAQQSPWLGEWGSFTDPSASHGQRLSISACDGDACTFMLDVRNGGPHCGTAEAATFKLTSPNLGIADLPGETKAQSCHIQLQRNDKDILVTATGDTCTSFYCTNATATFAHDYPRRAATVYTGAHPTECFTNASPARLATCTDPTLAKLEEDWRLLDEDFPLEVNIASPSAYAHTLTTDDSILKRCDDAADPAACLRTRYTADIAAMTAKQRAFIAGTTERGDPAEGRRIAQTIAGTYHHHFANGDVQGDKFTSTNKITIAPVGKASLHFDIYLEFYNGHECSLTGGALYRKDGSFVFDDDPTNAAPNEPSCRLAIVPTGKGVELKDLGGCKATYCGMRGSFTGTGFAFTDRVK